MHPHHLATAVYDRRRKGAKKGFEPMPHGAWMDKKERKTETRQEIS
jgi:hypothetical protein